MKGIMLLGRKIEKLKIKNEEFRTKITKFKILTIKFN
jgi:hypothetical protein